MHKERHDARCEDVILHVCIPSCPHALEDIEMDIIFRDLVELTPVRVGRGIKEGGCRVPGSLRKDNGQFFQAL